MEGGGSNAPTYIFPFPHVPIPVSPFQLSGLEEALEYCELEKKFANQKPGI